MLAADRDALACDLWETYQVRDMEALPMKDLVVLSCGLRDNSRMKMKMAGLQNNMDRLLIAGCFDLLMHIRCGLFGSGEAMPNSMYGTLMGIEQIRGEKEIVSFDTAEEWELERNRLLGGEAKVSD